MNSFFYIIFKVSTPSLRFSRFNIISGVHVSWGYPIQFSCVTETKLSWIIEISQRGISPPCEQALTSCPCAFLGVSLCTLLNVLPVPQHPTHPLLLWIVIMKEAVRVLQMYSRFCSTISR